MEEVNHNNRRRRYGAQDKDELINTIIKLHEEGYSQVAIAEKLDISRGTILCWNKEFRLLYQHGDIKLNRKYEIFLSLMR